MSNFIKTTAQETAVQLLGTPQITNALLYGGSRCIHGDTRVLTDKGYITIRNLYLKGEDFTVKAYDEANKRFVWTKAEAPFLKGMDFLHSVTLSNDKIIRCTLSHRFLTIAGYKSLRQMYNEYLSGKVCLDEQELVGVGGSVKLRNWSTRDYKEPYYDFTVPTYNNYVAEGVVHHNSGKTAILVYSTFVRALKAPGSRHLMLRLRFNHAKQSLVMDTIPKILNLAWPGLPYKLSKVDWYYTLPNGSEVWVGGLDDGERVEKILGNEYNTIYFNESSQLAWDAISLVKTRLAKKDPGLVNKLYFDCNPPNKRHWTYKIWVQNLNPDDNTPLLFPESYGCMRMNPTDNIQNLADNYIDQQLMSLSARGRQRFLNGEFQDDAEGALFKYTDIAKYRVQAAPQLRQIVVSIDPAVTAHDGSNSTGIVAAGVAKYCGEDHYYILEDASMVGTPADWARESVRCYDKNEANIITAEINQGGDLVEANLRTVAPLIPYKAVRATRGKAIRAEPVATACEKGRLHMVGQFHELEDELTTWAPASGEPSPDRLDAMVWAVRYLMGNEKRIGVWGSLS